MWNVLVLKHWVEGNVFIKPVSPIEISDLLQGGPGQDRGNTVAVFFLKIQPKKSLAT